MSRDPAFYLILIYRKSDKKKETPINQTANTTMDTLQTPKTNNDPIATEQQEVIQAFFQTDSASEMIDSIHFMVESFLFNENLKHITPEMRVHLVNQLRIARLVARLGERCR